METSPPFCKQGWCHKVPMVDNHAVPGGLAHHTGPSYSQITPLLPYLASRDQISSPGCCGKCSLRNRKHLRARAVTATRTSAATPTTRQTQELLLLLHRSHHLQLYLTQQHTGHVCYAEPWSSRVIHTVPTLVDNFVVSQADTQII